jgi:hypothetical protein
VTSGTFVGEELTPTLADGHRIGEIALVHLVDQPRVRPERLRRRLTHIR